MKTTNLKRLACILALAQVAFSARAQTGWTNLYTPAGYGALASAIAVNSSSNVFVTGSEYTLNTMGIIYYDYATIKYSNPGVALWTNLYTGAGGLAASSALAVDGSGNAFVTGYSYDASFKMDYATVKYSNAGVPLWTNLYNGEGHAEAAALAVDGSGNVFVTGFSSDGTNENCATIAYSNAGGPMWTNVYANAQGLSSIGRLIAVDGSGNVLVTDHLTKPNNAGQYYDAIIKYSNAGVPLWTNFYAGTGGYAETFGIAADTNGNAFVTGLTYNGTNLYYDDPTNWYATTLKYSNAGALLWSNLYPSAAGSAGSAALAVDDSGNILMTEQTATVKYSNTGAPLWTNTNGGTAIVVDTAGNAILTGQTYDGTNYYAATFKYSAAGTPLWTNLYTSTAGSAGPTGIALDGNGDAFVTGQAFDGTYNQYFTIEYPAATTLPLVYLQGQSLNQHLVLSWTNAGFSLQSAPAVTGTFTNVPGATSPYTNASSLAQQFFRLEQ
jgi:uncharacterized protein YegP (UPF0339 family)